MQNYQIIKDYLKTFPEDVTVGTIVENINKAEAEYNQRFEKQKVEMEKNIGKSYFFDELDDSVSIIKYYFTITDVTPIYEWGSTGTVKDYLYVCDMFEIEDDAIYYRQNYSMTMDDLKVAKEMDKLYHSKLFDMWAEFQSFNMTKD